MPRANRPADDTAIPDIPAAPEPATAPIITDAWDNWRFVGDGPLTYAAIPVTVCHGDVIEHHEIPADDGRWEATTEPVTRHADNHRPEPELPVPSDMVEEG